MPSNVMLGLGKMSFKKKIKTKRERTKDLQPGPIARSDARPTDIQEVAGSILRSANIISWRLVMT